MEPFTTHTGLVAPLPKRDVDTDQIIPKQFLKRLGRTGFDDALFYDWRSDGHGRRQPDFVLNDARYTGASVLLAGANFGCGSSREHAVWALHDYGFRVVLAPSFADIFASNAVANGLLAARIDEALLDTLVARAETDARLRGDGRSAGHGRARRQRTRGALHHRRARAPAAARGARRHRAHPAARRRDSPLRSRASALSETGQPAAKRPRDYVRAAGTPATPRISDSSKSTATALCPPTGTIRSA